MRVSRVSSKKNLPNIPKDIAGLGGSNTQNTHPQPSSPNQATFQENLTSTWTFLGTPTPLTSPTLKITTYLSTGLPVRSAIPPKLQYYTLTGRLGPLYNSTYIQTHTSCKPSDTYQWGFSYIFLFMMSIFHFLWSVIMVTMWLDTRRGSRMYRAGRRPGLLRSALDLSKAVREELGDEVEEMGEEELRERLRRSGGALCVPKGELWVRRMGSEEKGRRRTWRSEVTGGSRF